MKRSPWVRSDSPEGQALIAARIDRLVAENLASAEQALRKAGLPDVTIADGLRQLEAQLRDICDAQLLEGRPAAAGVH